MLILAVLVVSLLINAVKCLSKAWHDVLLAQIIK